MILASQIPHKFRIYKLQERAKIVFFLTKNSDLMPSR